MTEKQKSELEKGYQSNRESVRRAIAMNTYILPHKATAALKRLLEVLQADIGADWLGNFDNWYQEVEQCTELIGEIAKKELSGS